MDDCKACKHPQGAIIEKLVHEGKLPVIDAAKRLNMTYEEYWRHLKNCKTALKKIDTKDPEAVLNYLIKNLQSRVENLLAIPVKAGALDVSTEKSVSLQVRLLKDLVMDIAKLTHQIQESPQVLIQQVVLTQQNLTTLMTKGDLLCPICRAKVMEYLQG